MTDSTGIAIKGACEGPLKEVDLLLEYNRLHCFTGRAGAGARALAVDVLLAESRRRYMLSLAPAERARLGGLAQVSVQSIEGVPPAQFIGGEGGDASVGAYLQLEDPFFALVQGKGALVCGECGGACSGFTLAEAVQDIRGRFAGRRLLVSGLLQIDDPGKSQAVAAELARAGYRRVWDGERVVRLDDPGGATGEDSSFEVVVDRVEVTEKNTRRLLEGLESARALGRGRCRVFTEDNREGGTYNHQPTCQECGVLAERRPPGRAPDRWRWQGQTLEEWSAATLGQIGEALEGDSSPLARKVILNCKWAIELGLVGLEWGQKLARLSSGQRRRLQLAAALNQGLVGVLFVVDTPTLGLAVRQREDALRAVEELVRRGNTVIALDEALKVRADRVVHFVEGRCGDQTLDDIAEEEPKAGRRGRSLQRRLRLEDGVREADIPLDGLVALYGVSGAGKSSLWEKWVAPLIQGEKGAGQVRLDPSHGIRRALHLGGGSQQQAKGRTMAEALGIDRAVARLFAATPAAAKRKLASEFFMLKGAGGRCPVCEGRGHLQRQLYFLEDVNQICPECDGLRFRDEVREITLKGRGIGDVLLMDIDGAWDFFRREKAVGPKLQRARDGGLGLCRLGQDEGALEPFQRLMLQVAVGKGRWGAADLVFADNPAAGLHPADVALLADRLHDLVDDGVSVWVADQAPLLLGQADWTVEVRTYEEGRLPRLGYQGPWNGE